MPRQQIVEVLVGYANSDDAGVYQLTPDLALVQTVDFFSPIVDDPYIYGQIAAANSLSDIYAMGAQPKTALSLVGFPTTGIDFSVLGDIMRGGMDKLVEAGVALLGGHSVRDDEIKFGYAVTGVVQPKNIKQNSGARVGNRVILTKPLGTGLIATALKRGKALDEHVQAAMGIMLQLNRVAAETALEFRVDTMTDITGFGLIGHALEVAKASGVAIEIKHQHLRLLPGTLEYSRAGFCAGGLTSNREFFGSLVRFAETVSPDVQNVLFDPQTSGGLLLFCHPQDADALLKRLLERGIDAQEIGLVRQVKTEQLLTVT
jgi:selenide, water dikinase